MVSPCPLHCVTFHLQTLFVYCNVDVLFCIRLVYVHVCLCGIVSENRIEATVWTAFLLSLGLRSRSSVMASSVHLFAESSVLTASLCFLDVWFCLECYSNASSAFPLSPRRLQPRLFFQCLYRPQWESHPLAMSVWSGDEFFICMFLVCTRWPLPSLFTSWTSVVDWVACHKVFDVIGLGTDVVQLSCLRQCVCEILFLKASLKEDMWKVGQWSCWPDCV